jgi:hypothetical protein
MELLLSERAVPLTPELTEIMDAMYCMFWWGKNKSLVWYEDVVDILNEALDMDIE